MNKDIVMRRSTMKGTPGGHLREVRESRRFSQQDVAMQLRLSSHTIDAIENDDYRKLPGQIFVRGYLRSYARLLNLSEDDIIQAYNHLDIAQSTLPPLSPTYTSTYVGQEEHTAPEQHKNLFRWFIYLAALLSVIMLVKWLIVENPALNTQLTVFLKSMGWS